ncbi:MAG TPA: SUMF1/EgtB/PvdO family nonheme iron enzyme, partial [Candidatus Hydrogenedentes bacterium]|nr:SUMF1/EgtB/PvdO family nonheme iron enzyme [Candidatus Hydrogenedentota bacterium]
MPPSRVCLTGVLLAVIASSFSCADGLHQAIVTQAALSAGARQNHLETIRRLDRVSPPALRRAIEDLSRDYPDTYGPVSARLAQLEVIETRLEAVREAVGRGEAEALAEAEAILAFQRAALLDNPLLDFDHLLIVRRSDQSPVLGLPQNWQGNCSLPPGDYNNEIAIIPLRGGDDADRVAYRPADGRFLGDVDLHFDAGKMLFSMPDDRGRHQIWEVCVDGSGLRQVTPGEEPDVDNYDACYLPDERIVYGSTACYHGIPCVFGGDAVANLHIMNPDGSGSRQLCVDQDHNWCPTLLHSGRVLYLRWEYADLPHSNSRILFHMNPDGTGQMEYYGSNSYWPNGVFFARAVPDHPTMVVGIVTGHHGVRRMGELVLFDPKRGRSEADGVVQRIPGYGQPVAPIIRDRLVDDSWPKFLHPYPLSSKYFLTAAQPTPEDRWGIYLVDVFDNMLLLREEAGRVLFEPIPLRKTARPPIIADRVNTTRDDALVFLVDVYRGDGLAGIPRGVVKALRVYAYVFSYRGMGGLLGMVGMDGPWDVRQILGTVPVEDDGSALFRVPANTPLAVQPLDADGKALQLMRSWFTAMPGETLSCVGCHERQNMTPPQTMPLAARRAPSVIAPWYGPPRGFSFVREVQPVLDRHCVSCHDGTTLPDLRGGEMVSDWTSGIAGHADPQVGGRFSKAYAELHRYVRRPGIESDMHLLSPMDFHADTTELVQVLRKAPCGATLDPESWDRIITWIDLNAPYHGSWTEMLGKDRVAPVADRRRALRMKYCGMDEDPETLPPLPGPIEAAPMRKADVSGAQEPPPSPPEWPLTPEEARRRQAVSGETDRVVPLGQGVDLHLVFVPAGAFLLGCPDGEPDAQPVAAVNIADPFWMSVLEITNAQYALFDPAHDSHVESKHGYQFGVHGYPLSEPNQPVVRVSWEQAIAFCDWLSNQTGETFDLPTEAQWEYACRAGSATSFHFGDVETDFAPYANLGDVELARLASNPYLLDEEPLQHPNRYDDWVPRDTRFSDGSLVSAASGERGPNTWGLHDMHGNV